MTPFFAHEGDSFIDFDGLGQGDIHDRVGQLVGVLRDPGGDTLMVDAKQTANGARTGAFQVELERALAGAGS